MRNSLGDRNRHQFRALFWKSYHLQRRNLGTNLCQILTPIICLSFVYLIKRVALDRHREFSFRFDFPILFNVPDLYIALPTPLHLVCHQWYHYEFSSQMSEEERQFVGWNTGQPGPNMTHGLLSHIISQKDCVFNSNGSQSSRSVPYFLHPNQSINQDIYEEILMLDSMKFKPQRDMDDLSNMPDGAITFYQASRKQLNISIQVNDLQVREYHRSNGITKLEYISKGPKERRIQWLFVAEGQMSTIDLLSRAYLQVLNPDVWLVSGVQYMPLFNDDIAMILKAITVTGATLFPFALALLLPVFLYAMVLEKEERLIQMMKMNGMRMKDYWIMTYLFNILMTFMTFGLFIFFGYYIADLPFFTQTSPALLFLMFTGAGLAQISVAIFFQVFIDRSRVATIIGYLLSVWMSIMSTTVNVLLYPDPNEIPLELQVIPPVAFARLIYVLSMQCTQSACAQDLSSLTSEQKGCLLSLYFGAIFFGILGIVFNEIIPQEYGVKKSCNPFLKNPTKAIKEFTNEQINLDVRETQEDEDSVQERQAVYNTSPTEIKQYPLFCKDLCKVYKEQGGRAQNVAVKSLCLRVQPGEIFGLLGPNGAGKTTIISMLTGLYPSTLGTAWVGGYNISTELSKVQMNLGVCPQFDLLWPELTVEEHLLFYARLKGVSQQDEQQKVIQSMKEVRMLPYRFKQAMNLSGGMKRRLSIAIALVGDPAIVFLDEPSTGLDPENRRQLWDILVECRGRRAMVLTTHSMEEADVLCNRISIISAGVLRCIGPQVRLKSLYGGGYHLYISCHKDRFLKTKDQSHMYKTSKYLSPSQFYYDQVLLYISENLKEANLVSSFNGNFVFQINQSKIAISKIFHQIESKKQELKISDWGISQSSLEDVFMKIIQNL